MNFLTVEEIKGTNLKGGSNFTLATIVATTNATLGRLLIDSSYQLTRDQKDVLSKFNTFLDNAEEGITKDPMKQWFNREYIDQRKCVNLILPFSKGRNEKSALFAIGTLKDLLRKIQDRTVGKEESKYIGVLDAMCDVYLRDWSVYDVDTDYPTLLR